MRMTSPRRLTRCLILILPLLGAGAAPLQADRPDASAAVTGPVDRVKVLKSERRLILLSGDTPVREYRVSLGRNPVGHKRREGDKRTGLGLFRINRLNGGSRFHLSLGLDYPQAADIARAKAGGYDPGGDIMIHGLPSNLAKLGFAYTPGDWTDGCIAVTNSDMVEIWLLTPDNTPIEILP